MFSVFSRRVIGVVLLSFLVSCATKNDIRLLREDINENTNTIESRLSYLESTTGAIDSLLREQMSITQGLRAVSSMQSQDLADQLGQLTARQEELNQQLRDVMDTLDAIRLYGGIQSSDSTGQSSASSSGGQAATLPLRLRTVSPDTSRVNPQTVYESALSDLNAGNYLLAESLFLSFLMRFPDNELAGNAQYWLGEAAYAQQKYDLALREFQKVLEEYPESGKTAAALLKLGYTYLERGNEEEGRGILNRVLEQYGDSEEAELARLKLDSLQ